MLAVLPYVGVLLLAIYAKLAKKLTASGTIAAIFVGFAITWGFGWIGLLTLGLFFFSSSFLSSFKQHLKEDDINEKGSTRDGMQVLANGGVAAVMSVLYGVFLSPLYAIGFFASLAAANADTWASEIGPLSKKRPVHIATCKRVDKGTSGAISTLGTFAALVGSFVIACIGLLFGVTNSLLMIIIIAISGFVGNVMDTLIGAYSQVLYRCNHCRMNTERKLHCGSRTEQIRGLKWVNNDIVNVCCTISAAIIAMIIAWFIV
ncbi:DUF92 domain-containing protein [Halalkalibacter sp. AB-rgal2]|uniref:DUF92 domain-containing protein n=1 Tax=Halalkalibacter sp. AB-rgal2 TaxID=3242695 RepID=UPI00359D6A6E